MKVTFECKKRKNKITVKLKQEKKYSTARANS